MRIYSIFIHNFTVSNNCVESKPIFFYNNSRHRQRNSNIDIASSLDIYIRVYVHR